MDSLESSFPEILKLQQADVHPQTSPGADDLLLEFFLTAGLIVGGLVLLLTIFGKRGESRIPAIAAVAAVPFSQWFPIR